MSAPDVLIAGGGPVGLTLAIELGQLGVRCELVDKRPRPGRLPKMERCNARTMEHFRRMGISCRVRAAGLPADGQEETVRASYLVGCDGAGSTVRRELGIELRGDSLLTLRQALFHCPDLFARIPIGAGRHYHFADDRSSFLIVQDDTRHFSLHAMADSDGEMPRLFESLAGMPIVYETLYVGQWTQRLMLADGYRDGR